MDHVDRLEGRLVRLEVSFLSNTFISFTLVVPGEVEEVYRTELSISAYRRGMDRVLGGHRYQVVFGGGVILVIRNGKDGRRIIRANVGGRVYRVRRMVLV